MSCKLLHRLETESLRDYQPIPFWSWNDRLDPAHLRQQIQDMDQAGMGGFFMHARGGLETPYLGEEWFTAVETSADEAGKRGMNAWCYDENGWPSGFAGGALLKNPKNWAHYLRYECRSQFDPSALAVYTLDGTVLCRQTAPAAESTQYHCIYDCTNDSVTDILNPEIVDAFLQETHERYYSRFPDAFGKTIQGFFTDEPQYFRWDTAYSPIMLTEYTKTYGRNLLDELGGLFVECDGCTGLRFRYWRLMNTLYCENFAKKIYLWCESHNCRLTGHNIEDNLVSQMECCAGAMPFYEYEHIPGIDWLGRRLNSTEEVSPRQLSSVCQQLGKKQAITETFGCVGWDVTPRELKHITDQQYVNGVNLMCHHLYPYSIRGQRKRDYPAFYTRHNPWTEELGKFNAHYTALGFLLSETDEYAPVLMIHPMHSAYLIFHRNDSWGSTGQLSQDFENLTDQFAAAGIGHHYGDERLMEKYASVEGNTLVIGRCRYKCVVIPSVTTLDHSTATLLKTYVENGGQLFLAGDAPSMIDGEPADLSFLRSNVDFDTLVATYGRFDRCDSFVRATLRHNAEDAFLFAVNLSMEKAETVAFRLPFQGVFLFDPMTHRRSAVCFQSCDTGILVKMTLAPGESVVLFRDNSARPASPPRQVDSITLPLNSQMRLTAPAENALTLDTAALSYDGTHYTSPLPIMAISDLLLRRRENRTIWLRYSFHAETIPADLTLETETLKNTSVFVNGFPVLLPDTGVVDSSFCRGCIAAQTRIGENEIVLQLNYWQSDHTYQVFNGFYYGNGEITETLINCLCYETNIESLYLFGNFSVRAESGFSPGPNHTSIAHPGFTLCPPVQALDISDITGSGFPFLRGSVSVETEVDLVETDYRLRCAGRVQFVRVFVNDQPAGLLLFEQVLDLSAFLRPGRNRIRLELMASNRNLLGPFHCAGEPEPDAVGPDTFSNYGSWQDSTSPHYTPDYAFVRFGLDTFQLEK